MTDSKSNIPMHRWERRLADLAHILSTCSTAYFDPNLFRLNTNQFLTTARTVTFLIQKDKAAIPTFDLWYEAEVIKRWSGDVLMTWAKNSRNQIEKEGDLEFHSQLSVKLIYSYLEENDIAIQCARPDVLGANVKRLMRYAEKSLPTGIADASVLKIERRWVANSLPAHELLQALIYIYSRIWVAASSLAAHLGGSLNGSIPDPTDFDEVTTGDKKIQYVKFADRRPSSMVSKRVRIDAKYDPPPWIRALDAERAKNGALQTLTERVKFFSAMAKGTFEQFGNHVPMLYLFDEHGKLVDYLGIVPDDQATKFIFWRIVADRISYLRADSLVWIAELWIRDMIQGHGLPVRKMPIKGEMLRVIGMGRDGRIEHIDWEIVRKSPDAKPTLALKNDVTASGEDDQVANFLLPARRAFKELHGNSKRPL
jgi:hypothetical protein